MLRVKSGLVLATLLVLAGTGLGRGQQTSDVERARKLLQDPVQVADLYLFEAPMADLPEAKQVLQQLTWWGEVLPPSGHPSFRNATTLFEGLLACDVPQAQAYKRLLEANVVTRQGTGVAKRYLLVEYREPVTGRWAVWDVRESQDIDKQIAYFGDPKHLDNDSSMPAPDGRLVWIGGPVQDNYVTYGYWLMMAGRVAEAKRIFTKAGAYQASRPVPGHSQRYYDNYVTIATTLTAARDKP